VAGEDGITSKSLRNENMLRKLNRIAPVALADASNFCRNKAGTLLARLEAEFFAIRRLLHQAETHAMPMRGELPTVVARSSPPPSAAAVLWSRARDIVTNPELHSIVAFCTIGLLVMLNVMMRFPDLGALIAASAIFP
jgi:hypothetical protein